MKARKQPVKAQKSAQVTTTCNLPESVAIPPRVAAMAVFAAAYGDVHVPEKFRLAWAKMPAMMQQIAEGGGGLAKGVTREETIRALFYRDVEAAKANTAGYSPLPRVVEMIDAYHDGAMTQLEISLGDAAFYTGLAMGLYLSEGGR
jgi:hypothetical protein